MGLIQQPTFQNAQQIPVASKESAETESSESIDWQRAKFNDHHSPSEMPKTYWFKESGLSPLRS